MNLQSSIFSRIIGQPTMKRSLSSEQKGEKQGAQLKAIAKEQKGNI